MGAEKGIMCFEIDLIIVREKRLVSVVMTTATGTSIVLVRA